MIRKSVLQLACLLFVVMLISMVLFFLTAWMTITIPAFLEHHETVQEERWRNKAAFVGRACENNAARFVVLDCNYTQQASERDHFNETLIRTKQELTQNESMVHAVLSTVMGCDAHTGWCAIWSHFFFDVLMNQRHLLFAFSWSTTLLTIFILMWNCGPRDTVVKLRRQLNAESIQHAEYEGFSAQQHDEFNQQVADAITGTPRTEEHKENEKQTTDTTWNPVHMTPFDTNTDELRFKNWS